MMDWQLSLENGGSRKRGGKQGIADPDAPFPQALFALGKGVNGHYR